MILLVCALLLFIQISPAQTVKLNVDPVDNSTFNGKVMFGYQGWFGHPDDNSPRPNFWHWGNLSSTNSGNLHVEMYPDLREYGKNEKYSTAYSFSDGTMAPVFSSGNKQTVIRHMKWVRDYNTDGIFLQRFISEFGDKAVWMFRDSVASYVREGCNKYKRVWAVMWDGVGHADAVVNIKIDWMNLIDNLKILDGNSYLNHEGRPLVALWGYTFYDNATTAELESLIDWFHNSAATKYRASVMLGLNDNWFNKSSDWLDAFSKADVISPWSVGRYRDQGGYNNYKNTQIGSGKSWCDSRGILFVPVIWPGFSWYNLKGQTTPKNEIPRNGGNFYWLQSYGAVAFGNPTIYIAMLDELDEATAMFKTAENGSQAPAQNYWLSLDADGKKVPSDWYLRCAGKTARVIRGEINNSSTLGNPPPGIMTIRLKDNTGGNPNGSMEFIFPDFDNYSKIEISLDSGATFPFSTPDNAGAYIITGLGGGTYSVFVRHNDQMPSVDMGDVFIDGPVAIDCNALTIPRHPILHQNFPNPFHRYTKIHYKLTHPGKAHLVIIDVSGRKVRYFDLSLQAPGVHELVWDRRDTRGKLVPGGVYVYQIMVENMLHKWRDTKRMVVAF